MLMRVSLRMVMMVRIISKEICYDDAGCDCDG